MNEQLIKFIELCLMDGVVTDKEREVIFRKSKEFGVPEDECEIILEGMIQQKGGVLKNKKKPEKKFKQQKNIPLKEIENLEKLDFDKCKNLNKSVLTQTDEVKELENQIQDTNDNIIVLEDSFSNQKKELFKQVFEFLKNSKTDQILKLKDFEFKIDEIIESKEIKKYLNLFGSIEWGDTSRWVSGKLKNFKLNLNPKYPHPISVIFNYTTLGHLDPKTNYKDERNSVYIYRNNLKYFENKESDLLGMNLNPIRVLVNKLDENKRLIIVLFEKDLKVIRLNYVKNNLPIKYQKNTLEKDVWGNPQFDSLEYGRNSYYSYVTVEREFVDIEKNYTLKNS